MRAVRLRARWPVTLTVLKKLVASNTSHGLSGARRCIAWRSVVENPAHCAMFRRVGVTCDPEPDAQEEPEPLTEEELRFIDWLADEAVKEWTES